MKKFFNIKKEVDKILEEKPSMEAYDIVKKYILEYSILKEYVFNKKFDKNWLEYLKDDYFFEPPEPIKKDNGLTYPYWCESFYLERISNEKPKEVSDIILNIPDTENQRIHIEYINAAAKMPLEYAKKIMLKEIIWLNKQEYIFSYDNKNLSLLIKTFIANKENKIAFELAEVVLGFVELSKTSSDYDKNTEARAKMDSWNYKNFITDIQPSFLEKDEINALLFFINLLDKFLNLNKRKEEAKPEDFSYITRQNIDARNFSTDTIFDILIDTIIDICDFILEKNQNEFEKIYGSLIIKEWHVFIRIAFHLVGIHKQKEKVRDILLNKKTMWEVGLWNEYAILLKQYYHKLSEKDKSQILKFIDEYDITEFTKENGKFAISPISGKPFTQKDEIELTEWEQLKKLSVIADYLKGKWLNKYNYLVEKYGKPENPEYSSYIGDDETGPISPKYIVELEKFSVNELINYLEKYKPKEKDFGMSEAVGLGREIEQLIINNHEKYTPEIHKFKNIHKEILPHLFHAYRELASRETKFDWQNIFSLIKTLIKSYDFIIENELSKSIQWLIRKGFLSKSNNFLSENNDIIWEIISTGLESKDPELERDNGLEPFSSALNRVRSYALENTILYCLWLKENHIANNFSDVPKVKNKIENILELEKTLIVRSVLGAKINALFNFDKVWLKSKVNIIFSKENYKHWQAVMYTFIKYCRPHHLVFEILKPQYENFLGELNEETKPTKPDDRFVEHIIELYWRGYINYDDKIMKDFYENAKNELKEHVITYIGQALPEKNKTKVDKKIITRLKVLVEKRKENYKRNEFKNIWWWINSDQFGKKWLFETLEIISERSLFEGHALRNILKYILENIKTREEKILLILENIIKKHEPEFHHYLEPDLIKSILEKTIIHKKQIVADKAEDLVHKMGSIGFFEFEAVLELKGK
ncbi:MAG: hypothetical protein OEZ22_04910 [Spirochaetia bacterium]|nr:hypothetical protein [Spirochaetia bacterium]